MIGAHKCNEQKVDRSFRRSMIYRVSVLGPTSPKPSNVPCVVATRTQCNKWMRTTTPTQGKGKERSVTHESHEGSDELASHEEAPLCPKPAQGSPVPKLRHGVRMFKQGSREWQSATLPTTRVVLIPSPSAAMSMLWAPISTGLIHLFRPVYAYVFIYVCAHGRAEEWRIACKHNDGNHASNFRS